MSSVEVFDRDEMPLVLAMFSNDWNSLKYLDNDIPQARFAFFDASGGYRYVVTGYRWASNVVELIEFEIITWDHPTIELG